MKKVLFSLFVLAGFAACTSDDVVISESTGITSDTAQAYIYLSIKDSGSKTRATSGNPDYIDASEAEYNASNVYVYFYDEAGEFVSRGEVEPTAWKTNEDANIQWTSDAVVVLKGITEKGYPRYMVTVLNRPSDFEEYGSSFYEPAGTLAELETKLAEASFDSRDGRYNSDWGTDETGFNINAGIIDNTGNFVMSTTSFLNTDGNGNVRAGQYTTRNGIDGYYFVTELQNTDFYEEPVGSAQTDGRTITPVDVYVERLAARVEMTIGNPIYDNEGNEITTATWEDEDGNTVTGYLYKATIAGDGNEYDAGIDVEAGEAEAVEDIYIVLEGWKLNAKARESYIVKNLNTQWAEEGAAAVAWKSDGTDTGSTVAWQSTGDNRSFWGESFNYGIQHIYPTSSDNGYGNYTGDQVGNYDADEYDSDTWLDEYVKYTSLYTPNDFSDAQNSVYEYCAENTNTTAVLGARTSSGITSALVKARAYMATTDAETSETTYAPVTLIRYRGELFTADAYEAKIEEDVMKSVTFAIDDSGTTYSLSQVYLSDASYSGTPNQFGSADAAGTMEAIQATYDDIELTAFDMSNDFYWEQIGQGEIKIEFGGDIDASSQWVWIETTNANAETVYFHAQSQTIAEEINAAIYAAVGSFNEGESYAYYEGLMYYNVPIEHLNNSVVNSANGTQATDNFAEGQYGVVRNHAYTLTINGISELGHPISDEQEVIIPDTEEPVYLYVEAQINILAWKDVRQGVTLK